MKRFALLVVLGSTLIINYAFAAKEARTGGQATREMTFNKRYLRMPIKHGAPMRRTTITIDGKIVHFFALELSGLT